MLSQTNRRPHRPSHTAAGGAAPPCAVGTGRKRWLWGASGVLLLLLARPAAPAGVVKVERINPPPLALQAPLPSGSPAMSADGRFVAFVASEDLQEVFVRDRQTGTTERMSVTAGGAPTDSDSSSPAISAGGRFVAFQSDATNLVPGEANGYVNIYVRDRQTGTTELASVGLDGLPADGGSLSPAISADGRFVAFWSYATNLASGETDGASGVYLRDRQTGRTERVGIGEPVHFPYGGGYWPPLSVPAAPAAISAGGRFVAFESDANNLAPGDTNGGSSIFVRDRQTGTTERVGAGVSPALSADGRFVGFWSEATSLTPGEAQSASGLFLRDRLTGMTERVGVGTPVQYDYVEPLYSPFPTCGFGKHFGAALPLPIPAAPAAISADGRFVAFESDTDNLSAAVWLGNRAVSIYVRDRQRGRSERVSVVASGMPADGGSGAVAMSGDGRFIGFLSAADNPVPGDPNGTWDVLVAERE